MRNSKRNEEYPRSVRTKTLRTLHRPLPSRKRLHLPRKTRYHIRQMTKRRHSQSTTQHNSHPRRPEQNPKSQLQPQPLEFIPPLNVWRQRSQNARQAVQSRKILSNGIQIFLQSPLPFPPQTCRILLRQSPPYKIKILTSHGLPHLREVRAMPRHQRLNFGRRIRPQFRLRLQRTQHYPPRHDQHERRKNHKKYRSKRHRKISESRAFNSRSRAFPSCLDAPIAFASIAAGTGATVGTGFQTAASQINDAMLKATSESPA